MKHAKKLMVTVMAIVLVALMFGACGNSPPADGGGASSGDGGSSSSSGSTPAASGDKVELIFYSYCTLQEWVDEQLIPFYDEHPNIHVTVEQIMEPEQYNATQKTHFLNGTADLHTLRQEMINEFCEAGYLLDLSGEEFIDRFDKAYFELVTFGDAIYALPGDLHTYGCWYNKTMFDENGWAVPNSWDEYVALCETIRDSGVVTAPFITFGLENWAMETDVAPFLHKMLVEDPQVFRKLDSGEVKYTDPGWMEAWEGVANWNASGFTNPDILSLSREDASRIFCVDQDAAMVVQGNWMSALYTEYEPQFEMGAMPMFFPGANSLSDMVVPITIADFTGIAESSPNRAEALLVLDYLHSLEGARARMELAGAITCAPARDPATAMNPYTYLWLPNFDYPFVNFFWSEQAPAANVVMTKNLQEMFLGMMTPQQMAESMQAEQDKIVG